MNKDLITQEKQNTLSISQQLQILKKQTGVVYICDVSGSMSSYLQGKEKIEHLRTVLQTVNATNILCFASICQWITSVGELTLAQLNCGGGTLMYYAFEEIVRSGKKFKTYICISDGETSGEERTIQSAKMIRHPIETIYIGNEGDQGSKFMARLAKETGGQSQVADVNNPDFGGLLEKQVTLLLE